MLGISLERVKNILRFKLHKGRTAKPPPGYITADEAAKILKVSTKTVRLMISDGRLRSAVHRRIAYTTREWVDIYIQNSHYRQEAKLRVLRAINALRRTGGAPPT